MPTTRRRTAHAFTLVLGGVPTPASREEFLPIAEAIVGAGRNDASPARQGGRILVSYRRRSQSLGAAVGSAIRDIQGLGFRVASVQMDDEVEPVQVR
ncbi:hypothetical protein EP7_005677 (plasmid) [Isosphaeraceae bacterium EP7]